MEHIITLIVGESGSGKTTVCDRLREKYGMKQVASYTTRPPRSDKEVGHTFVSEADMPDKSEMCAYTVYNGFHYWATHQQVDEADLYVVDPAGVQFFYDAYRGHKSPRLVYIDVPTKERLRRMQKRGDSLFDVIRRNEIDKRAFQDAARIADKTIVNDQLDDCVDELYQYMIEQERAVAATNENL